jgi:putative oxygen-independent coproporphyrinogen III oxidase
MKNISANPGLYLHIPFCDTKCGYCDFYSITNNSLRNSFLQALLKEIKLYKKDPFLTVPFDTIYLGGGTPSLLTTTELNNIFTALYNYFPIAENCEITIETNPGTIDEEKLFFYKSIGVNRLSIGIQSFNDIELKLLGRIHSAEQAKKTYDRARNAGIENISIDLIYALPNQSLATWLATLETGLSLKPEHISAYNLTFEEGTPFYKQLMRGDLKRQSEGMEVKFFSKTMNLLESKGFEHYEISSYAESSEYISRHNYKYWNHTNYLSFGPSAHSYWNKKRWSNVRSISKYIQGINNSSEIIDFRENIDIDTMIFEKIMLGLRTSEGINLADFKKKFKQSFFEKYNVVNNSMLENGLAVIDNDIFKLTRKGMMICDEILPRFLPN